MTGIDLWLGYYDEFQHDTERLLGLLSDDERKQAALFHFDDDRLRYIVTRAMVRTVLSRYAEVKPSDWAFEPNRYGRPGIARQHAEAAGDLRFNLSHTRGLIVLGVVRAAELGVDVENLERQPALSIAERYFSPVEAAELAALKPEEQGRRFFEYWTLKESYIKALGKGIAHTLERFTFDFPSATTLRLTVDPALGDDAQRWHFWQLELGKHLLAVCAERQVGGAPPALTLFKLKTLDDFETLDVQPLKTSVQCARVVC